MKKRMLTTKGRCDSQQRAHRREVLREIAAASFEPRWWNVEIAADYLDVHPSTIYLAVKRGRLRAYRAGEGTGVLRFLREDLDAYMKSRATIGPIPIAGRLTESA
jgi:excisionase family DNA binding protein